MSREARLLIALVTVVCALMVAAFFVSDPAPQDEAEPEGPIGEVRFV